MNELMPEFCFVFIVLFQNLTHCLKIEHFILSKHIWVELGLFSDRNICIAKLFFFSFYSNVLCSIVLYSLYSKVGSDTLKRPKLATSQFFCCIFINIFNLRQKYAAQQQDFASLTQNK